MAERPKPKQPENLVSPDFEPTILAFAQRVHQLVVPLVEKISSDLEMSKQLKWSVEEYTQPDGSKANCLYAGYNEDGYPILTLGPDNEGVRIDVREESGQREFSIDAQSRANGYWQEFHIWTRQVPGIRGNFKNGDYETYIDLMSQFVRVEIEPVEVAIPIITHEGCPALTKDGQLVIDLTRPKKFEAEVFGKNLAAKSWYNLLKKMDPETRKMDITEEEKETYRLWLAHFPRTVSLTAALESFEQLVQNNVKALMEVFDKPLQERAQPE